MQADKLKHFAAGAAVAVLLTAILTLLGLWWGWSLWLGIVSPFVLGWGKEKLYDKLRSDRHTVDGWDAFATGAGAMLAPLGLAVASLLSVLLYILGVGQ